MGAYPHTVENVFFTSQIYFASRTLSDYATHPPPIYPSYQTDQAEATTHCNTQPSHDTP